MAETGKILFPVTAVTELQDAQTQWDTLVIVLNSVENLPGSFGAIKSALETMQKVRHLSSLAYFETLTLAQVGGQCIQLQGVSRPLRREKANSFAHWTPEQRPGRRPKMQRRSRSWSEAVRALIKILARSS